MHKQVYFAGSIRGGRADAAWYRTLIAYIARTDTVLTEHIGNLSLSVLENGKAGDGAIYAQDAAWLCACDLVIAECTCPSLGVGYELAFAEAHQKPCYVLYRKSRTQLSSMLLGNPYFHIVPYETEAEAFSTLDRILQ